MEVIVHVLYVRAGGINKAFRAERPHSAQLHATRHFTRRRPPPNLPAVAAGCIYLLLSCSH